MSPAVHGSNKQDWKNTRSAQKDWTQQANPRQGADQSSMMAQIYCARCEQIRIAECALDFNVPGMLDQVYINSNDPIQNPSDPIPIPNSRQCNSHFSLVFLALENHCVGVQTMSLQ